MRQLGNDTCHTYFVKEGKVDSECVLLEYLHNDDLMTGCRVIFTREQGFDTDKAPNTDKET